jgi:hypothetical protein
VLKALPKSDESVSSVKLEYKCENQLYYPHSWYSLDRFYFYIAGDKGLVYRLEPGKFQKATTHHSTRGSRSQLAHGLYIRCKYLPGLDPSVVLQEIFHVIPFHLVLNNYFDASLPLLESRRYFNKDMLDYYEFDDVISCGDKSCELPK